MINTSSRQSQKYTACILCLMSHNLNKIHLDARRNVVYDPDRFAVRMARQRVGDDVVLHLARGLVAGFDPIDGLTGGALQAAILVAIVIHGNKTLEVILVTTLYQTAHRLGAGDATHTRALVPRWSSQGLHADGAVLSWEEF